MTLSFTASPSRGRPRGFDIDAALDKSLRVFRERGYHVTSIADLTEAMELASGSVYKAFKNKRVVFLAAFDREGKTRRQKLRRLLSTAQFVRDRLRIALNFYAESSQGVEGKRGCLIVDTAAELAIPDAEVGFVTTRRMVPSRPMLNSRVTAGLLLSSCKACA